MFRAGLPRGPRPGSIEGPRPGPKPGPKPDSTGGPGGQAPAGPKTSVLQPKLGERQKFVGLEHKLTSEGEERLIKAGTNVVPSKAVTLDSKFIEIQRILNNPSQMFPPVFVKFLSPEQIKTLEATRRLPVKNEPTEAQQSEPPAPNKPAVVPSNVEAEVKNLKNQGQLAAAAAKASTSISGNSAPVVNVQKIANAAKELEPGAPKQGPGGQGGQKQGPGAPKQGSGEQQLRLTGPALGGPKTPAAPNAPRKGKGGKEKGNGNEPPGPKSPRHEKTPGALNAEIKLNPATVTSSTISGNGSSKPAVVATSVSAVVKATMEASQTVAEISGPPPKNTGSNTSTRASRKKERNEKKKANKQAGETSTQVGPVESSIVTVSKTGEVTSIKNLNGSPMNKTGNGFEISHFAQRKKVSRKELKRLRTLINNKEGQIQRATRKPRLKGVRWFFSTILGFDQGNIFRKYKSSIFGRKTKVSVEQLQGELQELKGDLEGQKQKYANDIFKAQAELEEKQSRIFSNAERRRKKKTGENQTFTTDIRNLQDTIKDLEARSEGVDKIIKTLNDGTLQEEILIKQEANEAKRTQRKEAKNEAEKTKKNILSRANTNNAGIRNLFGNPAASGGYFNIRKIKTRKLKYRKSRSHKK